jgi:cytochrome c oxidase subunit 3
LALLLLASGAVLMMNSIANGGFVLMGGFAVLAIMLFGWFGRVIGESEGQRYNLQVDRSFRLAMAWFIFSEVMFFVAFFGALFYIRVLAIPDLASPEQAALWEGFRERMAECRTGGQGSLHADARLGNSSHQYPAAADFGCYRDLGALGIGRQQAAAVDHRPDLTILLGVLFLSLQAYEYLEAYSHLNLKMTTGVYGSTFFMLTGFHGFHVTLGVTMLTVILIRAIKGHFTAERHFAFEGVAWYWHFVDVVWLGLFVVIYWL